MKKRTDRTPGQTQTLLEALTKLLGSIPALIPDRNTWDIEGDWQGAGAIYFVDARHMPAFAPWADFSGKTVKLINYDKAAVRMTFFSKHKYWLKKNDDTLPDEKAELIRQHLNSLDTGMAIARSRLEQINPAMQGETLRQIQALSEEANQWRLIATRLDEYEIALSTYRRGYSYLYINWKYRTPAGDFENYSEHLLNHQRDRLGNITQQRQNIVFVDTAEILRVHPNQHKEIELYLNNYPFRTSTGNVTIYARPRPASIITIDTGEDGPDEEQTEN